MRVGMFTGYQLPSQLVIHTPVSSCDPKKR
ncbi:hypothetical protein SAMN05192543_106249 [Paraburkholderia megapolitana]|uniref:Uncharacterized protein n=1 Tax=Paraburkholderia megapolitana TaxID=420953 RepID=A0A1I3Q817_9BURK|nr:hypothetical protein SAMN05192543_106249 [Paraburkholderia megapolitana]